MIKTRKNRSSEGKFDQNEYIIYEIPRLPSMKPDAKRERGLLENKTRCRKPQRITADLVNTEIVNEITPEQAKENRKRLEAMIRPAAKQKTVKQFNQGISQEKVQRQIAEIK